MSEAVMRKKLLALAQRHKIKEFRIGQEETMVSVLSGVDTLAIMPTGAGKSLCYQFPAELSPGTTIVVSPLISLMKDQEKKITEMGFSCQQLSSELTRKQTLYAIEQLRSGRMDIQFVTPEKLENAEVLAAFRRAGVSLFVVDEAHCISEWGHDFRPAYLALSKAVEALGHPPVLALTATATPQVIEDIRARLRFKDGGKVVSVSYRRDNLSLRARAFKSDSAKLAALETLLGRFENMSGIVYCASVKQTEALYRQLKLEGRSVAMYHGRMRKIQRRHAQERFMRKPGVVMIATSAFGMGIDKPDVRFVINYQIPSSLESYYQEVGRAGRDGERAYGILFYTEKDKALQRVLSLRKYPKRELLEQVTEALAASGKAKFTRTEIETLVGKKKLGVILQGLEEQGHITQNGRDVELVSLSVNIDFDVIMKSWERRRAEDRARLEQISAYVKTRLCRWYFLLKHFGESMEEPCGECDNCRAKAREAVEAEIAAGPGTGLRVRPSTGTSASERQVHQLADVSAASYSVGDYVRHPQWGIGEVLGRIGPNLRVRFPDVGEKTIRENFISHWHGGGPHGSGPHRRPRKDAA